MYPYVIFFLFSIIVEYHVQQILIIRRWRIRHGALSSSSLVQSFADYLSIEIGGIGKDLVCSCGLLNRLCSAFIRFGVVVT